jgi:hypothetical protein
MRAFVQRPFAFVLVSLAAVLSGRPLLAQSAEDPEEITVRGRKSLSEYRVELERARDEIFRLYNEANQGSDSDITCRDEQPTGSRMRQNVCRSDAEQRADAAASRDFVGSLLRSAGSYITNSATVPNGGGPQVNAAVGTGNAQSDGVSGEADALGTFEEEWRRVLAENRQLYRAVVKYVELEDEYNQARGVVSPPTEAALVVPVAAAPIRTNAPACEATTLTEYYQRNNVARVSGTISLANCPAGTTGSYNVVARVRDESGEIKPIEFSETWQRADAEDQPFNFDYPIGDDVELVNVRVRDLKCTCADAAAAAVNVTAAP